MREETVSITFLFIIIGSCFCGAQECKYIDKQFLIVCEKIVYHFPSIYYSSYYNDVSCQDCQIKNFDNETFPYSNTLSNFNVSHSGIEFIGPRSFSSFTNLRSLFLNNNDIKNISQGAFNGLNLLHELHLEHNRLITVKSGFLEGISSESIDISKNLLEYLPAKAFKGSISLRSLNLSRNHLTQLDEDTFEGLEALSYLDLSFNSMKNNNLPLGLFKSLGNLRTLNLAHNQFTLLHYGIFFGLENLDSLILAQNSLKLFDPTFLLSFNHLKKLDVSGNAISNFDAKEILLNVPTLTAISFEDNIFSCESLKHILQIFKGKSIQIENNEYRFDHHLNIHGIACIQYKRNNEDWSLDSFLQKSKEQVFSMWD